MAALSRFCPSISVRRNRSGFSSKLFSFDANLITVYTIIMIWDETKRLLNLEKHHLDFVDAGLVLSNHYRLEFESVRNGDEKKGGIPCLA